MARIKIIMGTLLLALVSIVLSPVPQASADDGVLRAGDVLEIRFPGEEAFADPFQIGLDGSIEVPEIGTVLLAGKPLAEAEADLRSQLNSVYRDISRFSIALLDRRLLVQVLGFVKEPGLVDLPASANIQTAITEAGGLAQGAQLDRLQLRRGESVKTFDYKAYLDSGDVAILPDLEPMDIVFVPASPLIGNVQVEFDARTLTAAGDAGEGGSAVKVFGEVLKPGSFAFKEGQSVVDMIMRAGGVTRYAGVEKIRVISEGSPSLFNLTDFLDTGNTALLPPVKAGTTIYVPISVEEVKAGVRTIYVMGEVAKPGAYDMTEGATFFDVLANSGGPTRYADTRKLRIIRTDGTVAEFDLAGYTNGVVGGPAPAVYPGDAIFVPEKADQLEKSWLTVAPGQAVHVMGQVGRPGRFEWSSEMSLLDLLAHAGGPTRFADPSSIQILKQDGDNAKPVLFDLDAFIQNGGQLSTLPRIEAGDTIMVPELPRSPSDMRSLWVRQSSERSIYVMGAVGTPGRFAFNENLHFLDILSAADGPRPDADIQAIRVTHRGESGSRVSKVNMALYFETGDETLLPHVRPGDVIYVPSHNRTWIEKKAERHVRVIGSVGAPGRYAFDDTMTILDLLAEAGGPSPEAWQEQIVVVNMVDGSAKAQSFNLVKFARTGDFSTLPVVRAGDTVYVPNASQSDWAIFIDGVRDVISVLSIFALIGAL
ncbi:MAG: SLBB domain-containing protein [Alphaproteobacteria bacterium]|nr:SLBB domain-containing protein [Alphaproteobacteria bacterium]